jgi:hypothetical protein
VYSGANSWGTAGGISDGVDREASPAGTLVVGAAGAYKEIALSTSLVQGWINGSIANYGLHLERTDGSNDGVYMLFVSTDGADATRPYLSVTYTASAGGGVPRFMNIYSRRRRAA